MNVPQLKDVCRGFPSASETLYEQPYNFLVYSVGGKKFAYFKTSHPERWRFSTRVAPDRFIELTDVPGVKPARYRGRFYWITIVNVSGFPSVAPSSPPIRLLITSALTLPIERLVSRKPSEWSIFGGICVVPNLLVHWTRRFRPGLRQFWRAALLSSKFRQRLRTGRGGMRLLNRNGAARRIHAEGAECGAG